MCINIENETSIINASIVFYEYEIIQKCSSITIKNICDMQITNKCVTTRIIMKIDFSEMKISVQIYIVVDLSSELILSINFLKV